LLQSKEEAPMPFRYVDLDSQPSGYPDFAARKRSLLLSLEPIYREIGFVLMRGCAPHQ
jgi:hypothetical protein